jgi:hypothetical protein
MPKSQRQAQHERRIKRSWLKYPLNKDEAAIIHNCLLVGRKMTRKEHKTAKTFIEALLVYLVGDLHDLPKEMVKKELYPK